IEQAAGRLTDLFASGSISRETLEGIEADVQDVSCTVQRLSEIREERRRKEAQVRGNGEASADALSGNRNPFSIGLWEQIYVWCCRLAGRQERSFQSVVLPYNIVFCVGVAEGMIIRQAVQEILMPLIIGSVIGLFPFVQVAPHFYSLPYAVLFATVFHRGFFIGKSTVPRGFDRAELFRIDFFVPLLISGTMAYTIPVMRELTGLCAAFSVLAIVFFDSDVGVLRKKKNNQTDRQKSRSIRFYVFLSSFSFYYAAVLVTGSLGLPHEVVYPICGILHGLHNIYGRMYDQPIYMMNVSRAESSETVSAGPPAVARAPAAGHTPGKPGERAFPDDGTPVKVALAHAFAQSLNALSEEQASLTPARGASARKTIVLYADDIINNAALYDLGDSLDVLTSQNGILENGRIILYSTGESPAGDIELLRKHLGQRSNGAEVIIIDSNECFGYAAVEGGCVKELCGLVEILKTGKKKSVREKVGGKLSEEDIIGIIRGNGVPQAGLRAEYRHRVPVIILNGRENGVRGIFSFAAAVALAIAMRRRDDTEIWVDILDCVEYSGHLYERYERERRELLTKL
ncbi:MAG: hypothetical protein ABH885_06925, partial [Candidatus Omnitrophota bacterium]